MDRVEVEHAEPRVVHHLARARGGGGGGGSLRRREVTAPHLDGAPGFEVLTAGYSFSSAPALVDAAVLVGFAVFYRAVAFVALKRTKKLKFT